RGPILYSHIEFQRRSRSKRRTRRSQPVPDRATVKLQLCSTLTAPLLWRCAATAPVFTRSIALTTRRTPLSFKNDILALAERAKGEDSIAPLAKLPHVMFLVA